MGQDKEELFLDWNITRLPTEKDTDGSGQVIVAYSGGGTYKFWKNVSKADFWFDPKLYDGIWADRKIVSPAECLARKAKGLPRATVYEQVNGKWNYIIEQEGKDNLVDDEGFVSEGVCIVKVRNVINKHGLDIRVIDSREPDATPDEQAETAEAISEILKRDDRTEKCLETHMILQFICYLQSILVRRRLTVQELADLVGEDEDWMFKLLMFEVKDIELGKASSIAFRLGHKLDMQVSGPPPIEEKPEEKD